MATDPFPLVSVRNASAAWDLRCEVREKLIAFLKAEMPDALPTAADLRLLQHLPRVVSDPSPRKAAFKA